MASAAAGDAEIPYWKDYKTNALRGVIAAVACAAIFIVIALVDKFKWKQKDEEMDNGTASYSNNRDTVVFANTSRKEGGNSGNGATNSALEME